ncbi:MAG: NAD(P)H-dependent oxidoreductase [Clostridia bacterium]|nr:NAD(P)H-dependent oxidoreductase [Clostridia bacterium]
MKVLVVNASPKGKYSITVQTAKYFEKLYSKSEFQYIDVGQKIRYYENHIDEAIEQINNADIIVFSYPVYTFMCPSQLHRFIELLKESGATFEGKVATQISTSKHFYDVTAHRYLEANLYDLGFEYIKGLSADMSDLTSKKGEKEARDFFKHLVWCYDNKIYASKDIVAYDFEPVQVTPCEQSEKCGNKTIAIVADIKPGDKPLAEMVLRFTSKSQNKVIFYNIEDFKFSGGCLGCMECIGDGKCVYKDGFEDFLRNEIQVCDAIVYAFSIKDHSMGPRFKMYDDRQFCNGHRTVTMGKPIGFIVSGNINKETNLKMVLEGKSGVGGNYLTGIVDNSSNPDAEIDKLAKNMDYALDNNYLEPQNFLGVGGFKIFRDLIYLMRGMTSADHKFFKKHHQYDFPQKQIGFSLAMYGAGFVMRNKKIKRKLGNKLNDGMISSYVKIIDKCDPID